VRQAGFAGHLVSDEEAEAEAGGCLSQADRPADGKILREFVKGKLCHGSPSLLLPGPAGNRESTKTLAARLASRAPLLCHRDMISTACVLGVDPGTARIGLALSDGIGCMAHPLRTIPGGTEAENARAIAAVAAEKGSPAVVIGLPRNMNGTYGPAAEKSRSLAEALRPLTAARVILWDERLTTAAATRRLQEAGRNSREQRAVIEQAAAVQILQDWIDAQTPPA